jgi:multidrug resistance protein, MATE family
MSQVQQRPFSREVKQSLRLSMPLMASQFVQASSTFVGTIIIAHLGHVALAASGLVASSWMALVLLFFGVLNAISILTAQNCGAKRYNDATQIIVQGFYWGILLSIPIMLLLWYEPLLLRFTGQSPAVMIYATRYVHSLIFAILPVSFLIVMEQFLIGIGKTRLVLWMSVIQIPFEILANYAFTFGKFGFPKMGIAGVGYGFALVFTLAALIIALYLARSRVSEKFPVFKKLRDFNAHHFAEIFKVGWPIGIMIGAEIGFFAALAFMMGRFGEMALAAHQIALQYLSLAITMVFGISQATGVRIGQAIGRRDLLGIQQAYYASLIIGFSLMLLAGIVYISLPDLLIRLDLSTQAQHLQALEHIARLFLVIVAVFQLIDSIRIVNIGALRGLKDTRASLLISLISFWGIALCFAYLFGFSLHFGGQGLWWGLVLGDFCGMLLLTRRFHRKIAHLDFDHFITTRKK